MIQRTGAHRGHWFTRFSCHNWCTLCKCSLEYNRQYWVCWNIFNSLLPEWDNISWNNFQIIRCDSIHRNFVDNIAHMHQIQCMDYHTQTSYTSHTTSFSINHTAFKQHSVLAQTNYAITHKLNRSSCTITFFNCDTSKSYIINLGIFFAFCHR